MKEKKAVQPGKPAAAIRLLSFDVDGVLLDGKYRPNLRTMQAIAGLAGRGVKIAFVGADRREEFASAGIVLGKEGYPHAFLAESSQIMVLRGGKYFPLETWGRDATFRLKHYFPKHLGWVKACRSTVQEMRIPHRFDETCGYFVKRKSYARKIESVMKSYLSKRKLPVDTCVMTLYPRNRSRRAREFFVGINVYRDKGQVLQTICRHFRIPHGNTLALGDSELDRYMLDGKLGFRSATVANADPDIKRMVREKGGYVSRKLFGEGVREILRALFDCV